MIKPHPTPVDGCHCVDCIRSRGVPGSYCCMATCLAHKRGLYWNLQDHAWVHPDGWPCPALAGLRPLTIIYKKAHPEPVLLTSAALAEWQATMLGEAGRELAVEFGRLAAAARDAERHQVAATWQAAAQLALSALAGVSGYDAPVVTVRLADVLEGGHVPADQAEVA